MRTIGASAARRNLAGLLKQVRDGKGPITIERRGKPLAALVPVEDLEWIAARKTDAPPEAEAAPQRELTPRTSHGLFEETEQLARLGHWEWDEVEDRCTYCSKELARLHGVSVETYLRRTNSTQADLAWVHPEDRRGVERIIGNAR